MEIDPHLVDRETLRGYFRRNAVPTEKNFAALIDSGFNQVEDGVAKPYNQPLSLSANTAGNVLAMYGDFSEHLPRWSIAIGGETDGLAVHTQEPDGDVTTDRVPLFIDRVTGSVGLGTTKPTRALDVNGGAVVRGPFEVAASLEVTGNAVVHGSLQVDASIPNYGPDEELEQGADDGFGAAAPFFDQNWERSDAGGLRFPGDPAGGGADRAWLTYYPRRPGTESMTLELGVSNDWDDHISLMPSGNVGIGTREPQTKLHVAGGITADGPVFGTAHLSLSDGRLKTAVHGHEHGLETVRCLRPVSFDWLDRPDEGSHLGLVAQDVQEVLPEVVSLGNDVLALDYNGLVSVLIRAVQEIDARLTAAGATPTTTDPGVR